MDAVPVKKGGSNIIYIYDLPIDGEETTALTDCLFIGETLYLLVRNLNGEHRVDLKLRDRSNDQW